MIDLNSYRGTNVNKTKQMLETMGYNVIVVDNFERPMENSHELVVGIFDIGNNTIKIVSGKFKFLSEM